MELPWNTYSLLTSATHNQDLFTRCSRRSGWDVVNFFSENNSENEIKVHLTCERCFAFFTSSFMEPSLLHQRGFLQRTQLSRVGPGHQSSMSLLRHWFPGPHSQTMEFGIHVSLENICRASSRRRCKYKCSLQNALEDALRVIGSLLSNFKHKDFRIA